MADAELKVKILGDVKDLESAISKIEKRLGALEGPLSSNKAGSNLNKATVSAKKFGEALDTTTKPIQKTSVALAAGGVAAAKFAIDFENNFANVTKTVDGTDAQLKKIKQDIIDMSTKGINGHSAIPQTTTELTELAAAGGQLGVKTENISAFTETMAMLGSATNLAGEDGAKSLARFMNVTGVSQEYVQNLGSAVVDLGNNFATTEAEIMDMGMNMGATAAAVNISAQDTLAYAAVLSSLGAEAAAGGSAVSRIWMDIQTAVSSGGSELSIFAQMSGKSADQFSADWRNNASGAFKDLIKGLSESKDIVGDLQRMGFNNIRDIQALQKLAGPQGLELLNDALERSNNAWSDNTALLTEFDNKADTTASKLTVTKNNIIEAARAVGETFLPAINNGATKVTQFAQTLANMDEGQKQTLVSAGAWVIGIGGASKVVSAGAKAVGTYGAALKTVGTGVKTVVTAHPAAAAAVGVLTVAAVAGKKAYDAWYKSQYKWTEGLSEADEKTQKNLSNLKKLTELQKELKNARLVIENPQSSKEAVDNAKEKIEEIAGLLANDYNLKINVEDDGLDETVEHVKNQTESDLLTAIGEESIMLSDMYEKYQKSLTELPKLEEQYQKASRKLAVLTTKKAYENEWLAEHPNAVVPGDAIERMERLRKEFKLTDEEVKEFFSDAYNDDAWLRMAQDEVDDLQKKINDLSATQKDYVGISTSYANKLTEYFEMNLVEGDFGKAENTLKRLGKAAANAGLDLEGYSEILTNIAKASGMLNDNQSIRITAEGDIEIIEEVEDKADSLNGKKVEVKVNADGTQATATIDGVTYKVMSYDGQTGTAILSADGETADMVINLTTGEVRKFDKVEGKAKITAIDDVDEAVESAAAKLSQLKDKEINITAVYREKRGTYQDVINFAKNGGATSNAKGTQNFGGGLAVVNDEKGVLDPRELIEIDGKGYIFEGRDVVVPLPKHAKIYTAKQTKEMLPHFAGGNNNEAWEQDKSDWTHYTKINDVTAIEALAHWDDMLVKYKNDAEVIKDIQEEIASSTKDMWQEDLAAMKYYLDMGVDSEEHYYAWLEQYRDDHFEGNTEQWRKATVELKEFRDKQSKDAIDAYINDADGWINHERTYNAMSADDYIAALARKKSKLNQFLSDGLMAYEDYAKEVKAIDEEILNAYADKMNEWRDEADFYMRQSEVYGWGFNGTGHKSEEDYWWARLDKELGFAADEALSATDRQSALKYADEARMSVYKARQEALNKELEEFRSSIENTRTTLDKEVQELQDSWNKQDREKNIAETEAMLAIYKNAQTKEGKDKYSQLHEELETLKREEKIAKMQGDNNATLEKLEAEYTQLEKEQANQLSSLKDELLSYGGVGKTLHENLELSVVGNNMAEAANEKISGLASNLESFCGAFTIFADKILAAVENIGNASGNSYNVEQNVTNVIRDNPDAVASCLKNAGMLSMALFGRR